MRFPASAILAAILVVFIRPVQAEELATDAEPVVENGISADAPEALELKTTPIDARPVAGEEPAAEMPPAPDAETGAEDEFPDDESSIEAPDAEEEGDGIVGPSFPASRYTQLWERSPFQLESIAPPVQSEGLAQRYALTGIAEISDIGPIVFLMERATQQRLTVQTDSGDGGLSLVGVDLQQKYADSTATVRQGGEVGVVKFDAVASMPSIPQQTMPVPGRPMNGAQAVPQQGMPQPAQIPGSAQGIPGQVAQGQAVPVNPAVPGVVPGVPGPGVEQGGEVPAQVTPAGQVAPPRTHRRRAMIPSAPAP